jgi:hypothetical protein
VWLSTIFWARSSAYCTFKRRSAIYSASISHLFASDAFPTKVVLPDVAAVPSECGWLSRVPLEPVTEHDDAYSFACGRSLLDYASLAHDFQRYAFAPWVSTAFKTIRTHHDQVEP